jgi:hypothetical protein
VKTDMKVYLAGRYSRREEFAGYAQSLAERGIAVTSRWLGGNHKVDNTGSPVTDAGDKLGDADLRTQFCNEDIADVKAADVLVLFTEDPTAAGASRGGRHVEFGMAMAWDMALVTVGPYENLFTYHPRVAHFDTWAEYLAYVDGQRDRRGKSAASVYRR